MLQCSTNQVLIHVYETELARIKFPT
uniref:Uncharacterized protein n=1 Tax=Anguilla anguilla TaxID=7936 RepID=A0A0E9SX63_ANGAN